MYSVSVSKTTYLYLGSQAPFYSLSLVTTFSPENIISTESIRFKNTFCLWAPSLKVLQQKRILSLTRVQNNNRKTTCQQGTILGANNRKTFCLRGHPYPWCNVIFYYACNLTTACPKTHTLRLKDIYVT